jgi:hypothetical protein
MSWEQIREHCVHQELLDTLAFGSRGVGEGWIPPNETVTGVAELPTGPIPSVTRKLDVEVAAPHALL